MNIIVCDYCHEKKELAYTGKWTLCADCFRKLDERRKLALKLRRSWKK